MILTYDNVVDQFAKIFTSWSNPVFLILFITVTILFLLYFFNKYLIKPLEKKHKLELLQIEFNNSRMMALFAELDPDPVIRVDKSGIINFFNNATTRFFKLSNSTNIYSYIKSITEKKLGEIITNGSQYSFQYEYNGAHFNVLVKGDSSLGIAHFYLRDITSIKNLELQLKQLSNYLQNQLDEERFRIANELHDGIIQEMYLIKMGISKLNDRYDKDLIGTIKTQIESTTEELRSIIYDLKPKVLDELGLVPATKTLCNNIMKETNIKGSLEIIGLNGRLDKKLEICFYRIIQEALGNIVKHSNATEFEIVFFKDESLVRVIVKDNGSGLKLNNTEDVKSGFGFINMRERIEGLGGILVVNSIDNEGLTIIAEVPVKE